MTTKDLAKSVIETLKGRKSFDAWWHEIDPGLQENIIESICNSNEFLEVGAKLSERKTVHEWLNDLVPKEEFGKPICLLRRLRILCDEYRAAKTLDEIDAIKEKYDYRS